MDKTHENTIRSAAIFLSISLLSEYSSLSGAAEGASSNYFPGTYGDYAAAVGPEPGWLLLDYNLFYTAEVDRAVLQGRETVELDVFSYVNMPALLYTFEEPVAGARFSMGVFLPVGVVDLEATLPLLGVDDDARETNIGDANLLPASLYWNTGNWHVNLYELVIAPTGQYDVDNAVNLGRNYWSFDSVLGVTYLDLESGRDFSIVAGYMINGENDDTDYQTGDEFHVDWMLNQFFCEGFALGVHGYYYKQVEGDSGDGAILGNFKGESVGIGPSVLWTPAAGDGKFSITGTWLHDLDATNRLESDYGVVTLVWQL
jgi:hypothetical protein